VIHFFFFGIILTKAKSIVDMLKLSNLNKSSIEFGGGEYCTKSIEINLARRSAHYLWGNCSKQLGDIDGAIEHYLEELKNNPDVF